MTITVIALVAVIMGMSAIAPMIQYAEAHIVGKIRGHSSELDGHDGGVGLVIHDGCPDRLGFLHYVDINGNAEHDDPGEPTLCLRTGIGR